MGDSGKKEKGFFKFFSHERSSQIMKIPTAYTKYKNGKLPQRVILRDRYGNMWLVGLVKKGEDLYFHDGWPKFVEENNVEDGDFIIFDFDGKSLFDFTLLGKTACEKRAAGGLKLVVMDEVNEHGKSETSTNMNLDAGYDNSTFVEEEDDNDDDKEYEEEDEEIVEKEKSEKMRMYKKKRSCPQGGHSELEGGDEDEECDEEDVEEDDEDYIIGKEGTSKNNAPIPKAGCKRANAKGKRHVFDRYGADIFRSGRATQPKNPYFVTKIQPRRRDQVYVPVDLLRDHNLELPEEMILRDPTGRNFKTRLNKWKDGRIWLVGGWRSLCRWNLVEEQDSCICEIIKGNDEKDLYLQVHVVLQGAASNPN